MVLHTKCGRTTFERYFTVISFLGKLKEMIPENSPYSVNRDMNMFSVG
jgi:hypothetical protein